MVPTSQHLKPLTLLVPIPSPFTPQTTPSQQLFVWRASMDTAQLFRMRLLRDLRDIQVNGDPGFIVHPASDDMRRLCLQLCPESGPWAFLRLHFNVELPANWPAAPPRIWISADNVQHPNIISGGLICADIFREAAGGYNGSRNIGYNPGYTLRGVFKQLLSVFSSSFITDNYGVRGEHLGKATISHFASEADIVRPFRQQHPLGDRKSVYPYVESEAHLEKIWNADVSEEVLLLTYESEDGSPVRQLTKRSMMRDHRAHSSTSPSTSPSPRDATLNPRSTRASTPIKRIFKFESRSPFWERTRHKIQAFEKCDECGYGSHDMPHYSPKGIPSTVIQTPSTLSGVDHTIPYMIPAKTNQLSRLKMDTLQVLCEFLSDESLRTLRAAYQPVDQFLIRTNFVRKRQLRCFYLASTFQESSYVEDSPNSLSIMGMGIQLDPTTNRLSSDTLLDGYLSEAAFQKCGVRRTVRKKPFGFFLPLTLNYRHFKQIKPRIYECLKTLSAEVAKADPRRREFSPGGHHNTAPAKSTRAATARLGAAPGYVRGTTPALNVKSAEQADIESVNILYKFLNDVIVSYMRTVEAILDLPHASVKQRQMLSPHTIPAEDDPVHHSLAHAAQQFLPIYWQVFHLLISLCRENPAILKAAHARVRQFIEHKDKRSKEYEPELGELVVVAALVFACQDEGLLPAALALSEPPQPVPEHRSRHREKERESQASQTTAGRRYDLRNPVGHAHTTRAAGGARTVVPPETNPDPYIRWSDHFAGPLLQETMTRGVGNVLDHSPDLQWLETGVSQYRIARTFQHMRSQFRLAALQVSMLAVFSYYETQRPTGAPVIPHPAQTHLDRVFGNPPAEAIVTLTEEVKAIHRLSSWGDFFTKVQYKNGRNWSDEELSAGLRQCVLLSEQRGYHINHDSHGEARRRLFDTRERRENEWMREHDKRARNRAS
ncbi:hypothetical protein FRC14_006446 [Serendipita sp. 396]|nr:hypothetical protein FRC14_006446 [Serendipita sp. 396]